MPKSVPRRNAFNSPSLTTDRTGSGCFSFDPTNADQNALCRSSSEMCHDTRHERVNPRVKLRLLRRTMQRTPAKSGLSKHGVCANSTVDICSGNTVVHTSADSCLRTSTLRRPGNDRGAFDESVCSTYCIDKVMPIAETKLRRPPKKSRRGADTLSCRDASITVRLPHTFSREGAPTDTQAFESRSLRRTPGRESAPRRDDSTLFNSKQFESSHTKGRNITTFRPESESVSFENLSNDYRARMRSLAGATVRRAKEAAMFRQQPNECKPRRARVVARVRHSPGDLTHGVRSESTLKVR